MKKIGTSIAMTALLLMSAVETSATTITVDTGTSPLSLAHAYAYMWGVQSSTWDALTNPITSASITVTNIWDDNNYRYENDQLALFLLDDAYMKSTAASWRSFYDGSVIDPLGPWTNSFQLADSLTNLFSGITPLVTYYVSEDIKNTPTNKVTLTYNFTAANLVTLQSYLTDPVVGRKYRDIAIGLDPDCHFQLDKVTLNISDNAPVPEPTVTMLFALGVAGFVGVARRRMADR